jgi:hypothetical protein
MTPPVSTATTAAGPAATATADQTTADQALTGEDDSSRDKRRCLSEEL